MQEIRIKAEMEIENKRELSEEVKKRLEEEQDEIREDAKKLRRPTTASMMKEIQLMIKRVSNSEDPNGAKYARALLCVFLRELVAHNQGKHVKVAMRLQTEMKEKQPLMLWKEDLVIIARAAIRYEIAFGRVAIR